MAGEVMTPLEQKIEGEIYEFVRRLQVHETGGLDAWDIILTCLYDRGQVASEGSPAGLAVYTGCVGAAIEYLNRHPDKKREGELYRLVHDRLSVVEKRWKLLSQEAVVILVSPQLRKALNFNGHCFTAEEERLRSIAFVQCAAHLSFIAPRSLQTSRR